MMHSMSQVSQRKPWPWMLVQWSSEGTGLHVSDCPLSCKHHVLCIAMLSGFPLNNRGTAFPIGTAINRLASRVIPPVPWAHVGKPDTGGCNFVLYGPALNGLLLLCFLKMGGTVLLRSAASVATCKLPRLLLHTQGPKPVRAPPPCKYPCCCGGEQSIQMRCTVAGDLPNMERR